MFRKSILLLLLKESKSLFEVMFYFIPEVRLGPCQTSMMRLFSTIVDGLWPFTIFAKSSTIKSRIYQNTLFEQTKNMKKYPRT